MSEILANKITPVTGTTVTLGDSGDTFTIPSGVTVANSGTATGFGKVVQVVNTQTGAVATTTTDLPDDDTIPVITEGGEFMTLAVTPTSASNKLMIDVVAFGHTNGVQEFTAALFQDSTSAALAAGQTTRDAAAHEMSMVSFRHFMTAGTTSATTMRVRIGGAGTTFTFNGVSSGRLQGGVLASSITITEISV
mgnify:CR=1 FL=1